MNMEALLDGLVERLVEGHGYGLEQSSYAKAARPASQPRKRCGGREFTERDLSEPSDVACALGAATSNRRGRDTSNRSASAGRSRLPGEPLESPLRARARAVSQRGEVEPAQTAGAPFEQ